MSRRVRTLTPAEAASLIAEVSDSSGLESDGDEYVPPAAAIDSDEDALAEYVDELSDAESDADPQPPPVSRQQLTRSQQVLDQADLQPHPPSDAGPYVVRDRRQSVIAEWQTTPPPAQRRRDPANILTEAAAVRGRARNVRSEAEAFKLFITDAIIEKIVAHTNDRLRQERQRIEAACSASTTEKTAHRLQDVTHTKMCAFLGLCILRGFYSRLTLRELFNTATGPAIFTETMGRKRFSKLLQFVSFDDLNTREDRRPGDKFCHLREIFNEIDQNLRRHFRPSECLTLDESLVRFRGRCPFKMYLPSKPGKYGLLVRTVADANHRYMYKMWPYSGRPAAPELAPPGTFFESVPEMVKHMVREVAGTGRNVTMDRYFTSIPLTEDLLAERLTVVGTINKRRKFLPKELTEARGRQVDTHLFAFRNDVTLVSTCHKPGKLVLAVSTQHRTALVDSRTNKPDLVLYYNATKGGVDVMDAITEYYMYKPPVTRWPTAFFFFLMGVAQVNASTVLMLNRGHDAAQVKTGARRSIMYAMGQQLVQSRLAERVARPTGLNSSALSALTCVTGLKISAGPSSAPSAGTSAGPSAGPSSAATSVSLSSAVTSTAGHQTADKGRCVACLEELRGTGHFKREKDKLTRKPPCSQC